MDQAKVAVEKAALRTRFRLRRTSVPARAAVDAAIVARVLALPEVAAAQAAGRVVLAFWPLAARGEVDVRPLVAALAAGGVALPAVIPGAAPRLAVRRFTSAARLVAGPWGLMEPAADAPAVAPADLAVVVVPALALGRDGSRLGAGGGYYDAFLPTTAALRVGVAPAACVVDALPHEPHDARLDVVVTEHETVRVPPGGRP